MLRQVENRYKGEIFSHHENEWRILSADLMKQVKILSLISNV